MKLNNLVFRWRQPTRWCSGYIQIYYENVPKITGLGIDTDTADYVRSAEWTAGT
jgi:hypothetical protein